MPDRICGTSNTARLSMRCTLSRNLSMSASSVCTASPQVAR